MCQWRFEVFVDDDWDSELASFPFAGGVRPSSEDREHVLRKVRRAVAGYVNAHPEVRDDVRIVEMSCNGPQRAVYPYRQGSQGGELRLDIGGWEFLPGEEEELPLSELPEAPEASPPGPASRPSPLADSTQAARGEASDEDPAEDPVEDPAEAVVALRDGRQVAVFATAEEAREAIAAWSPKEADGVHAFLVDLHGERLAKVWPVAEADPVVSREVLVAPLQDEWQAVKDHFEAFTPDPEAKERALERLKTWARIATQEVADGSRANDEEVSVRASTLYSLRHALRAVEAQEGRLVVGRDDSWAPEPAQSVAGLEEVKEALIKSERGAVYALEPDGSLGARLYPLEELPYKVWSAATANLVGEFETADEAIALAEEDPDDLIAFKDALDGARATVIYDPNDLTLMSLPERRERLRALGRWPSAVRPQ